MRYGTVSQCVPTVQARVPQCSSRRAVTPSAAARSPPLSRNTAPMSASTISARAYLGDGGRGEEREREGRVNVHRPGAL